MKEIHTSLLREKFVIHDPAADVSKGPVVALSNRIVIDLTDQGKAVESLVVRAQNMHTAVRMGARLIQSFLSGGPILSRPSKYDWESAWDSMQSDYERAYNPQRWLAVYAGGKPVFASGDHHAFLDVIEKCEAANEGDYERSMKLAENAFRQAGKVVRIDYDGNVALTAHLEKQQSRFGLIVRGPLKTATFNFTVSPKPGRELNYPQCLTVAACFLEGIQLSFMVGMNEEKIRIGKITRHSKEESQTREARRRLSMLNAEISNLEGAFDVRYRPERPEFQQILTEAEKLAKGMF